LINAFGVLAAVNLDDEPFLQADKVNHKTADGVLPAELVASEPSVAQMPPQPLLGFGLLLSQLPFVRQN